MKLQVAVADASALMAAIKMRSSSRLGIAGVASRQTFWCAASVAMPSARKQACLMVSFAMKLHAAIAVNPHQPDAKRR